MTPEDHLRRYRPLVVNDVALGISASIDVTRYISGMDSDGRRELGKVAGRLAGKYFGSKNWSMNDLAAQPQPFTIKGADAIEPTEPFTYGSLVRAYGGRASPDEMVDAIRLAVLTGRCKASEAGAYGKKWLGQDCNAFVGNWLGVSPSTSISAYANGYGESVPSGSTPDVLITKKIVKLPPVADPANIRQGSVLITFAAPSKATPTNWRHIALVQAIRPAGAGRYYLTLAEWGGKGGFEAHMTRDKLITLTEQRTITYNVSVDKDKDGKDEVEARSATLLKGVKTVAFKIDYGGYDGLCFFLDSTSLDHLATRGYKVGGMLGT